MDASVEEVLRAIGIGPVAGDDRSALRLECARLARLVRERLVRSVGLAPAGDDVAVPGLAIALGQALADASRQAVGVVDASGTWACARALAARAAPDGAPVATSWILDNLALLTPRSLDPGATLAQLRATLADESSVFKHLVVDLTGLEHAGEHIAAFEVLDAVIVVARSGRTTSRQIRRAIRDLPKERGLGVLLTGI